MSKKTTETKPEKQTEKMQPTELKYEHLDEVQGGKGSREQAATDPRAKATGIWGAGDVVDIEQELK